MARKLFNGYDEKLLEMLSYLERIIQGLVDLRMDQVMIDFGLVHQAEYYSSLIFPRIHLLAGEPVLSGGRYDELFKDFGKACLQPIRHQCGPLASRLLKESKHSGTNGRMQRFRLQQEPPESGVNGGRSNIRIALTKGRLENSIVDLFDEMGYDTAISGKRAESCSFPFRIKIWTSC
jgi:hypothetical protein